MTKKVGMYTFRVEDGRSRGHDRTIFIITTSLGIDLVGHLNHCHEARAFCEHFNKQAKRMQLP